VAIGGGGASLGGATGFIRIDTDQAQRNLRQLQGQIGGFANATDGAFSRIATGTALLGVGAAVGRVFGAGISQAASFEQAMDGVAASLGGVGTAAGITADQMTDLNDEALRIGETTSVGANEAAQAMTLLARAGVDVESILNGAAQAAVNLSEATGESLMQSAESIGAILNLFPQLEESRAADIFTNALNASNATLSEFQTGIARLAPAIVSTGMSFEEAAGLVAFFNSQGLSAAEVGTSLNSIFASLATPTAKQAQAMETLGISAYDAQGNFVGLPNILDQVGRATSKMTPQARDAALGLLFERDALDVVNLALERGPDAISDYIASMDETGTAAEASATRMDNLRGSLEELRGSIESVAIRLGSVLLPPLRLIVDAITVLVRAFGSLPVPLQAVAAGGGVADLRGREPAFSGQSEGR
jgi:TP901 family phage tail tape measure protein